MKIEYLFINTAGERTKLSLSHKTKKVSLGDLFCNRKDIFNLNKALKLCCGRYGVNGEWLSL